MLIIGILIGLAIAICAFGGAVWYWANRLIIRSPKRAIQVVQRLSDFGEDLESLVLEVDDEWFAQFRKFIVSKDDWGVDFVCPLVGNYESCGADLKALSEEHGVRYFQAGTEHGWDFAFVQITRDGVVEPTLARACLALAGLTFEQPADLGSGGSFDWGRRRKVQGQSNDSAAGRDRYNAEMD